MGSEVRVGPLCPNKGVHLGVGDGAPPDLPLIMAQTSPKSICILRRKVKEQNELIEKLT